MSDYEKERLRQFCDIVEADGIVRQEHLREVAEIVQRLLLFEQRRQQAMERLK